jgi:nicotinate-nucleotide adenylyltransferase
LARLGLYGGTFDPIHIGHLHVVTQLLRRDVVDRIFIFPAGQPRLRDNDPVASGAQRRHMCELAVADLPKDISSRVEVNPIEILRDGPSYTIDTVEAVAKNHPEDSLHLIIGSDAYVKLDQWHRIDELKKLVTFIIINRPGVAGSESELGLDIGALNVASTGIREESSTEYSPSVAHFIKEHHLYGS